MTITILCAGALARPGAHHPDIEADSRAPQPAWLRAARLRNEVRAAGRPDVSVPADDGAFASALRRAQVVARSRDDAQIPRELPDERWLRERFDLVGSVAACTLPLADVLQLVVRPVHLHLGLDQLMLAPPSRLAIDAQEAHSLAQAANRWLADDELVLVAERPDAWALRAVGEGPGRRELEVLATLRSPSARTASGRNIDAWQPEGDAARRWRQLNNLIQMSWFEHPVNEARAAQDRLTITGPWLEGCAGAARRRAFDQVWTNDPAIAGLAVRAGAETREVAPGQLVDEARAHGRDHLARAHAGPSLLLAPGFWQQASEEGDAEGWSEGWRMFERWFGHAVPDAAKVPGLHLVFTGERDTIEVELGSGDRYRIWRKLRMSTLFEG